MFNSILYPNQEQPALETAMPLCFKDMNLDQVLYPLVKEKNEFNLDGFYYTPLKDKESIIYRQDVMRDMENPQLRFTLGGVSAMVNGIGQFMHRVQKNFGSYLEDKWRNNFIIRGQMVDCVDGYCNAVIGLSASLLGMSFKSEGLRGFSDYLKRYIESDAFKKLQENIRSLREKLKTVKYNMLIKGDTIRIRKFADEPAFTNDIITMFEKFKQNNADSYARTLPEMYISEKVEAGVLEMLAKEYKEVFDDLRNFCDVNFNFMDETIVRFSSEIHFYIAWLDFIAPLQNAGLNFCYPEISNGTGDVFSRDTFDIALARNMRGTGIVPNDFDLHSPEHIIVITGPNQGGKSTFARAFGQSHYLASLGLSVPGSKARLFHCDGVQTHFGKQEDLAMLSGQLQDDLMRLRELFDRSTSKTILIINEIFASTTLQDALALGQRMMDKLVKLGAPAIIITFLEELANHGPETFSMVSMVKEDDHTTRTYKILRKKPDGMAFAMYIAGKRGMTYDQLKGRLGK